jgi:pimeloyl-ACP methyl ester carboxylesterase
VRVVVTHGWIADHTLFDPFIDCIDRARFTYAFLDCRGYGTRRDEPGLCTMDTVAAEVRAVTSRLGWPRFHVIGHSMGGMVAQRLMVDVPDRLASVILLAPVPASGARLDATRRALLQRAIIEPAARRALITANTGASDRGNGSRRFSSSACAPPRLTPSRLTSSRGRARTFPARSGTSTCPCS